MFWRNEKGVVMYRSRWKHPPPPRGWKEQVVRFLHKKVGGVTDGARNFVILHRQEEYIGRVVLKTWASWTLIVCLDAKFRGMTALLVTEAPIRYQVCWQGNRKLLYWVL